VLDTAQGLPAAGLAYALRDCAADTTIASGVTNADGRCDVPLLQGEAMKKGCYVLRFNVAQYFRRYNLITESVPFLDVVEIHFGIADPAAHYHVPLLVSPYSYTTYRGS